MKTTTSIRPLRFLELALLLLLSLTPFLPWSRSPGGEAGYGHRTGISLWSSFVADSIDAQGNLTYDQMTLAQVLQVGYLTSAIIQLTYLIGVWGYAWVYLGETILARRANRTLGNLLLYGGLVFVVIVGIVSYREMEWGYWVSGAILAVTMALHWRLSFRQGKLSLPSVAG